MSQPDRNRVLGGELEDAADMVAMFMRHQDRRQRLWFDVKALQAPDGFPDAKAAVEQYPRTTRLHHQRISLAPVETPLPSDT